MWKPRSFRGRTYLGKSLGVVLEWAIRNAQDPRGILVNYSELPSAFSDRILPHFGIEHNG